MRYPGYHIVVVALCFAMVVTESVVAAEPHGASNHLFKVPPGVSKMTVEVELDDDCPKQKTVEIIGGRIGRIVLDMDKRPQFPSDKPAMRPNSYIPGIIKPGNVATASNGATVSGVRSGYAALLDGDTNTSTGIGRRYAESPWPCEWIVKLDQVYRLQEIRLKLWDGDNRYYRYAIETSTDGKEYEPLVDRSQGQWKSWQFISFPPRPVKSIKIHGLYNSINEGFHVTELEAYCLLPEGKGVSERVAISSTPIPIANSSFETGGFSGWTVFPMGSGIRVVDGDWNNRAAPADGHESTCFVDCASSGGDSDPNPTGVRQRLDISDFAAAIDKENATVSFCGWGFGEAPKQDDFAVMSISFFDAVARGNQIGSPVFSNKATVAKTWTKMTITDQPVPVGARSIELTLQGDRTAARRNDAGFDDVSGTVNVIAKVRSR